jgi:hypothetical protein
LLSNCTTISPNKLKPFVVPVQNGETIENSISLVPLIATILATCLVLDIVYSAWQTPPKLPLNLSVNGSVNVNVVVVNDIVEATI